MTICPHGNRIAPPGSNCLYCIVANTMPKISIEPLPNGWHLNGKLYAEEGRFVLLDHFGQAMAEFASEKDAASVLFILLRGLSVPPT